MGNKLKKERGGSGERSDWRLRAWSPEICRVQVMILTRRRNVLGETESKMEVWSFMT